MLGSVLPFANPEMEASRLQEILNTIYKEDAIAVKVNNQVISVPHCRYLNADAKIEAVHKNSIFGISVYRHTLSFILAMSVKQLFPNKTLSVEHAFGLEDSDLCTAYYCELNTNFLRNSEGITEKDIQAIKQRMIEIVQEDLPIEVVLGDSAKITAAFSTNNQAYSQKLVQTLSVPTVFVNRCGDFQTLYILPLAPKTGMMSLFDIQSYKNGLVLMFPSLRDLNVCPPFQPNQTIHDCWQDSNSLWNQLKIGCIGDLNQIIMSGDSKNMVQLCEAYHDRKIVELAKMITDPHRSVKIVLIAGPSSSGKTTFSHKLSIHLQIAGLHPLVISSDDYYKDHSDPTYPRTKDGTLNYECIQAIRTDLFNQHLLQLFAGEEVEMPLFDFISGQPKAVGVKRRLEPDGVIICEGIFCLSDEFTSLIPNNQKFRIYILPICQLNLDENTYFSNQVIRTIRRICRDYNTRGRKAEHTITKWESVRDGEVQNIFPNIKNADVVFNSSLEYEIPVLSVYVSPLLRTVTPDSPAYPIASRLLEFLRHFQPMPAQNVPSTSLLREFIGGGDFGI